MPISTYIRDLREKIGHDLIFVPGVAAIVQNEAGDVLLERRSDNGDWCLPGGAVDPGEEPADAIIREVREETGVEIIPERIVSVSSGTDHFVEYPNGDRAIILSITFACRAVGGEARVNDEESTEVRYVPLDQLPATLHARHRQRIEQALKDDPRTFFRVNHSTNGAGHH